MLVLETIFMHIDFYSCSVINICSSSFSLSLFLALLLSLALSSGIFFFLFLSIREIERKHRIIPVVFSFSLSLFLLLSLSQPKILPASVHTHIYQSEEMRVLTHRFFFFSLYWPNLAPILLLSWFFYSLLHMPTYKNRVCIYIHTHKKESNQSVYIEERCTILSTHAFVDISSSSSSSPSRLLLQISFYL